jgi:hypothetical protein
LLYDDEVIRRWYEHAVRALAPGAALFDMHCHTGFNDPDGFTFSGEQLVATLAEADARGVVMSMHEPDLGYARANDRVLAEAQRCVEAGARGIKLHPRAEKFELHGHAVEPIFALAHEHRLPILIHAGRGKPTLAVTPSSSLTNPGARIILAHAAGRAAA